MPSQPLDLGCNFSSVFDLIDSDVHNVGSPALRPNTRFATTLPEGGVGLGNFWKLYESLGMATDNTTQPLPPLDESELSNSDDALLDDALPPSPAIEVIQAPPKRVEVQQHQPIRMGTNQDTSPQAVLTKKQRQKARKQAEKARQEQATQEQEQNSKPQRTVKTLAPSSLQNLDGPIHTPSKPTTRAQSNVGAKIRPTSPVPTSNIVQVPQTPNQVSRPVLKKQSHSSTQLVTPQPMKQPIPPANRIIQHTTIETPSPFQAPSAPPYPSQLPPSQAPVSASHGLVPRTVRPVTLPRHSYPVAVQPRMPATPSPVPFPPTYATPLNRPIITIRSQVDRHFHLFEKLLTRFSDDRKWLVAPRQLVNENTKAEGVHVFVDASNIMIGFKDMLRTHGVQPYDMSFDSLALLMERRRPVAKRVFVGSHREANPHPQITKLVQTSKAVGYECNVQEQVFIAREESKKKKFFNDVNRLGWHEAIRISGSGSDSETGTAAAAPKTPSAPKWVEQGVDELLHLKMCDSMIDTQVPSTMVLATGDGAEAEMSDGFLAYVERALSKGWKVELVTWKQQTNGGYKRRAFRQKWGENFSIIELDEFLEDLIDTP